MKTNRKRILTAVVFAVTLILGVAAMALAWRLQQDEQITEEEAAAGECCSGLNACDTAWPGYYACDTRDCAGCSDTSDTLITPKTLLGGGECFRNDGKIAASNLADALRCLREFDVQSECISLQSDGDGGSAVVLVADNGAVCYSSGYPNCDGFYCNIEARRQIKESLGLSDEECYLHTGEQYSRYVCRNEYSTTQVDLNDGECLKYSEYLDWTCEDVPTTQNASISGGVFCVDQIDTDSYTKVPLSGVNVFSKINDGSINTVGTTDSSGEYSFSQYINEDNATENLVSLSKAQVWITGNEIGDSVTYNGKTYDTSNLNSLSAVDCININAAELQATETDVFNTYYSSLIGLPLFYVYNKIGNYDVGACEWYEQNVIPSYTLESINAGATTDIDFTFEEPCPEVDDTTPTLECVEKSSVPASGSFVQNEDKIVYTISYHLEGTTAELIDELPKGFSLDTESLPSNCMFDRIEDPDTSELLYIKVYCNIVENGDPIEIIGYVDEEEAENTTIVNNKAYVQNETQKSECNSVQHIISTEEPTVDCVRKEFLSTTGSSISSAEVSDKVMVKVTYSSQNITGNLTVVDELPSTLSPLTSDSNWPNECSASGNTVTCTVPSSGTYIEFPVKVTSIGLGSINNTAEVIYGSLSDEDGCSDSLSTTTIVEDEPNAGCTSKVPSVTTINAGGTMTYTLTLFNGSVAATTSNPILITDTLPSQVTYVSYDVENSDYDISCSESNNVLTCEMSDVPANTDNIKVDINVRVNSDISANTQISNSATVKIKSGDTSSSDNNCEASTITIIEEEKPSVVCSDKRAIGNINNAEYNPGETVTYSISYNVTNGPATIYINDTLPEYTSLVSTTDDFSCTLTGSNLYCVSNSEKYSGAFTYSIKIDETGIPLAGVNLTNNAEIWTDEQEDAKSSCEEEIITVKHEAPVCIVTNPDPLTIRLADASDTIEMTTTGYVGSHSDLEFKWVMTYNGVNSIISAWHDSSGTPSSNGYVTDTINVTPPSGLSENDTFEIRAYVRPDGSTDDTGITSNTSNDYDCDADVTVTALDLICNWMVPNDEYEFMPFDMTFAADIAGDEGAAFTYDLDFGDGTTHYTGSSTVASGTTIELPYIPPQSSPHTYNSTTEQTYGPVLTVTNTETGETSICPTTLGAKTQSDWSIVKDSDVDTCAVENSTVTYSIVVTNTGDYTADLTQVRDTLDSKINTSTITNIRECDSNGLNCTTYSSADVLTNHTITWPGRTFTAGESRKYMYTVQISSDGDYYNIAEAIPESGETIRDDEIFPTCTGKSGTDDTSAPETGVLSTAAYIAIIGMLVIAGGYYAYRTEAGAQVVANVMGKTGRAVKRSVKRKETFERDAIKSSKDKLKR